MPEVQPDLIRSKPVTRPARRLLAFLDPRLCRPALIVKLPADGILEREIRHDEADALDRLTNVVLDFRHGPSARRKVRLIGQPLMRPPGGRN